LHSQAAIKLALNGLDAGGAVKVDKTEPAFGVQALACSEIQPKGCTPNERLLLKLVDTQVPGRQ
jgi:hypothetical protein